MPNRKQRLKVNPGESWDSFSHRLINKGVNNHDIFRRYRKSLLKEIIFASGLNLQRRPQVEELLNRAKTFYNDVETGSGNFDFVPRMNRSEGLALRNGISELGEKSIRMKQMADDEELRAQNNLIPRNSGARGDGQTHILCVNVGSGDCTTITTPMGKLILMDFGSDSTSDIEPRGNEKLDKSLEPERIQNLVSAMRSNRFLGMDKRKIDCLILSHTDIDHHNLLHKVLGGEVDNIEWVYFSGGKSVGQYQGASDLINSLPEEPVEHKKLVVREIKEKGLESTSPLIKINNNKITTHEGMPNLFGYEFLGEDYGHLVLYSETDERGVEVFRLSVLASNVEKAWDQDENGNGTWVSSEKNLYTNEVRKDSNLPNRKSMVVLVETQNGKMLICADATAITERSMVNLFSGLLQQVTHVRIPHHGSLTSSSIAFLDCLQSMQMAIASAPGENTVNHKHPVEQIMDLYVGNVPVNQTSNHSIWAWYWERGGYHNTGRVEMQGITGRVFATGTSGNRPITL